MSRTYRNEDNEPRSDDEFEDIKHLFDGINDDDLPEERSGTWTETYEGGTTGFGGKIIHYPNGETNYVINYGPDQDGLTGREWHATREYSSEFKVRELPVHIHRGMYTYEVQYADGTSVEVFAIPESFKDKVPITGSVVSDYTHSLPQVMDAAMAEQLAGNWEESYQYHGEGPVLSKGLGISGILIILSAAVIIISGFMGVVDDAFYWVVSLISS